MFTGIIETTAKVTEQKDEKLILSRPKIFSELKKGQSIAVNGACLSVVDFDTETIRFDVVPETFAKTNLQKAKTVNMERAMTANGRFEGHVVLGHIDGTTEVIKRKKESSGERFIFRIPGKLKQFFVQKGSICINGVSLTIANCNEETFEIALIPLTLKETNLGNLTQGDSVNIEADYFAKLLFKWQKN